MKDLQKLQEEIKDLVRKGARLDFEKELIIEAKKNGDMDILEFVLDFVSGGEDGR